MSNRIKSDDIQIGNSYVLPIEQSNVTLQQAKVKKIIEETDARAQQIIGNAVSIIIFDLSSALPIIC